MSEKDELQTDDDELVDEETDESEEESEDEEMIEETIEEIKKRKRKENVEQKRAKITSNLPQAVTSSN